MATQTLTHPKETAAPTIPNVEFEHEETRALADLVDEAAGLLRTRGEEAFEELGDATGRWQRGETYIFVLDPEGNMLVHPDPELRGSNVMDLRDVGGKPIIRGLIDAATANSEEPQGWYHYQWPVPGGLLPRWKSSFVRLVEAPSEKRYVVGSGTYNDRMERAFVVDLVRKAVAEIEKKGKDAFDLFRDPTGPFIAKDAYVFVTDMNALELVNPAFPSLEGRDLLDMQDANGKYLNRELLEIVMTRGSGWSDYMWPKPGESVATQKSAFVSAARSGDEQFLVGCGVYLADAPKEKRASGKTTASELMKFVREAADVLAEKGVDAFPEFRTEGSKWYRDDLYLFVYTMEGDRLLQPPEPESEGRNYLDIKDSLGRPVVEMILDIGRTDSGEGWIHYVYPEPGSLFPTWKSSFMKRVTFPSGEPHMVGAGIYNMNMERAFIEDLVNRAAELISARGKAAFDQLRDRKGPFYFMDTYVFVESPEGVELVNPAHPALEGKNLMEMEDAAGKKAVKEEVDAALKNGRAWTECFWYKPGDNTPVQKQTFVRSVKSDGETFIVGSGIYEV